MKPNPPYIDELVKRKQIKKTGQEIIRICKENPGIVKKVFLYPHFDGKRTLRPSFHCPGDVNEQIFLELCSNVKRFLSAHGVTIEETKSDRLGFTYWEADVPSGEANRAVELLTKVLLKNDLGIDVEPMAKDKG